MRTNLLRDFVANGGRVGEAIPDRFSAVITADKAGDLCGSHRKSRPWGPGLLSSEFVQRGWRGELSSGDRRYRG